MNASIASPEYQVPVQEEKLSIRYIKEINSIAVKGRSTGLEVYQAYKNLIEQVEKHFLDSDQLNCYFFYSVINASTTKMLFNLFRRLVLQQSKGNKIIIHWVIEDNDQELMDVGLDLKSLYDLDFRITTK